MSRIISELLVVASLSIASTNACGILYNSWSYHGAPAPFYLTDGIKTSNLRPINFSPSSARVNPDCFLTIFDEYGNKQTIDKDVSNLGWGPYRRLDGACCECGGCASASLRMGNACARLFENPRCDTCTGFRLDFKSGDAAKNCGQICMKMSSVAVRPGCRLTVYSQTNFNGKVTTITGSNNLLPDEMTLSARCECDDAGLPVFPPILQPSTTTTTRRPVNPPTMSPYKPTPLPYTPHPTRWTSTHKPNPTTPTTLPPTTSQQTTAPTTTLPSTTPPITTTTSTTTKIPETTPTPTTTTEPSSTTLASTTTTTTTTPETFQTTTMTTTPETFQTTTITTTPETLQTTTTPPAPSTSTTPETVPTTTPPPLDHYDPDDWFGNTTDVTTTETTEESSTTATTPSTPEPTTTTDSSVEDWIRNATANPITPATEPTATSTTEEYQIKIPEPSEEDETTEKSTEYKSSEESSYDGYEY